MSDDTCCKDTTRWENFKQEAKSLGRDLVVTVAPVILTTIVSTLASRKNCSEPVDSKLEDEE